MVTAAVRGSKYPAECAAHSASRFAGFPVTPANGVTNRALRPGSRASAPVQPQRIDGERRFPARRPQLEHQHDLALGVLDLEQPLHRPIG